MPPPTKFCFSDGCIHAHPDDVAQIWQSLLGLGVDVRENPYSSADYPYDPQGLLSVYLMPGH